MYLDSKHSDSEPDDHYYGLHSPCCRDGPPVDLHPGPAPVQPHQHHGALPEHPLLPGGPHHCCGAGAAHQAQAPTLGRCDGHHQQGPHGGLPPLCLHRRRVRQPLHVTPDVFAGEREILPVWGECLVRLVVLCQWLQMVHGGRVGRDSSVVECQTGDQKVAGLRRNGRIFLSSISFLCWLLFQYPFHPCVTGIARKRPWSFHQEGRWQLTCVCGAIDPQKHWQLVHNSLVTCLWSRTYTKTLTMTPQLLSNVFVERDIYSYIDNDSTRTTP